MWATCPWGQYVCLLSPTFPVWITQRQNDANSRTGCDILHTAVCVWFRCVRPLWERVLVELKSKHPNLCFLQHLCSFLCNLDDAGPCGLRFGAVEAEEWHSKVHFSLRRYGHTRFSNSVWLLNFGFGGRCLTFGSIKAFLIITLTFGYVCWQTASFLMVCFSCHMQLLYDYYISTV